MSTQLDPGSSDQSSTMSQNCSDSKYEQAVDSLLVAMIWLKNPVWLPRKEPGCKESSRITWQELPPNGQHSFAIPQDLQVT